MSTRNRRKIERSSKEPAVSSPTVTQMRRLTASLLLQSTALITGFVGVPVLLPLYSRAYGQSTCNPPSVAGMSSADISATTFSCTISGSASIPQLGNGGSYNWYTNSSPDASQPGMNISITNNAIINVTEPQSPNLLIGSSDPSAAQGATNYGLSAISRGNNIPGKANDVWGGAGGNVYISNAGTIQATSKQAVGIFAASYGGFGSGDTQESGNTGGRGGDSGAVTIVTSGDVTATSAAIVATSTGGRGGIPNGDNNIDGSGGDAGAVSVLLTAGQVTSTQAGVGVEASSYGGAAGRQGKQGNGGSAASVGIYLGTASQAFGGTVATTASWERRGPYGDHYSSGAALSAVSRGGSGYRGNGGDAGDVTVNAYGANASLITKGSSSPGIYAQSYGGQGNDTSYHGGTSGAVTVSLRGSGSITTAGAYSSGIVALSNGGVGQSKSVGTGSDTAQGGESGNVSITSAFSIATTGTQSHGIVGISAGAGGGMFQYSGAGSFVWGDQNANSASAGNVAITNTGAISTQGSDSHGILAESIGGGGGALSSNGTLPTTSQGAIDVSAGTQQSLGGNSGGAAGGTVTVRNYGRITTVGGYTTTASGAVDTSSGTVYTGGGIGILAQSIGGGGGTNGGPGVLALLGPVGASGSSGANGGSVNVTNGGAITTYGSEAHGIVAQSIGGGGGNGRNKHGLVLAVGGSGGNGGDGGTVTVEHSGAIVVSGEYAGGIIAQSIGGGGGSGGKATSWGTVISASKGGSGGGGGDGQTAQVRTYAGSSITTSGTNGTGLLVQSIGGGGGTGGASKATSASLGIGISLSFGGSGGGGGTGGTAEATSGGIIRTSGYDSAAITVQSIGGGGGAGGSSAAKSLVAGVPVDPSDPKATLAVAISFSHGGKGGTAANGGNAFATNTSSGQIYTSGHGSVGMLVQSVGGGGGAGGDSSANSSAGILPKVINYATGAADPQAFNFSISTSLGGTGGGGGAGGYAEAFNQGRIATTGQFSDAIMVQSIGGGGGNATTGNAQSKSAAGKVSVSLSVGLGATGGDGGAGGFAAAGNVGTISTSGNDSRGMLVQSIGGGGGTSGGGGGTAGGTVGIVIGLGAAGTAGGNGGTVYAWNAGNIVTSGDWADGILAQSIGGGGGMGGAGDSSLTVPTPSSITNYLPQGDTAAQTATFNVTVGSDGGAGGDGGAVVVGKSNGGYGGGSQPGGSVTNGSIITSGILSNGITAQSIGGGGGAAAVSNGSSSAGATGPFTADLTIGASGGSGGNGSAVSVYASNIRTSGFGSHGVLAQSIGGGGGSGATTGFSIPSTKIHFGNTTTTAASGNGGAVTVTTLENTVISTGGGVGGTDAFGILAQSIGGGGGTFAAAFGDTTTASAAYVRDALKISLGSMASSGNANGGAVTVNANGAIATYGTRNIGILAQSIGAGGGVMSTISAAIKDVSFVSTGASGISGAVNVSLNGTSRIYTSGDGAIGVVAQSIAGGGAFTADATQKFQIYAPVADKYAYTSGSGTSGGVAVTLATGAAIVTSGAYAHGIFAQAFSGGGGVFQKNGVTYAGSLQRGGSSGTGNVQITTSGQIHVAGQGAWGIFSQAGSDTNDIAVEAGGVVNASGASAGAIYAVGRNTGIQIAKGGAVGATSPNGIAIQTVGANITAVTNSGLLQGNLLLSGNIVNKVYNTASGTFISGTQAQVGSFENYGTVNVGGTGSFVTTTFSGNLTGNGGIVADVDMVHGTSDRFIVGGTLSGQSAVTLNAVSLLPNVTVDLFKAEGGVVTDPVTVLPTPIYQFTSPTLQADGWYGFSVQSANFTSSSLTANLNTNQQKVSGGLQSAWNVIANGATLGSPATSALGAVFGQFYSATPANYPSLINSIYSSTSLVPLSTATETAMATASSVLSCPAFEGDGVLLQEGSCDWARVLGGVADRTGSNGFSGFSGSMAGMQVGRQKEIAKDWFLGATIGYQSSSYQGTGRAETLDNQTGFGAVALKRQMGPWLFALAAGGGYNWGDSTRTVSVGSLSSLAEGSPTSYFLFGRARASYELIFNNAWYAKPMLDVDVMSINQIGYTETGLGPLNLAVQSGSSTFYGITPALEVGGRFALDDNTVARPFAVMGVSFLSGDTWSSRATFVNAPGMQAFETLSPVADMVGRLDLGLDIQNVSGVEVKLQYTANVAEDYFAQGASLRLGYKF